MNFINDVDNMKKSILENNQYMKSFEGSGDTLREELKKFNEEIQIMRLELGETLIRLKTKQKRLDLTIQTAAANSNTLEEFELKYAELNKSEEKKRFNVKKSAEYKEFKQELVGNLNASNADGNDDMAVEIMESDDNACSMYDPWTKALMLHPMRNIMCGHHYDRDSVMALIEKSMSIRCPFVGCASKTYIQPNHLQADLALQEKINKHKAGQDAQESSEDEN